MAPRNPAAGDSPSTFKLTETEQHELVQHCDDAGLHITLAELSKVPVAQRAQQIYAFWLDTILDKSIEDINVAADSHSEALGKDEDYVVCTAAHRSSRIQR